VKAEGGGLQRSHLLVAMQEREQKQRNRSVSCGIGGRLQAMCRAKVALV
jgi:hypothetical protein